MSQWSWAFWIASVLLTLFGLVLLYRALFSDRSRGRRRCPKCWYDMAGVPGLTCPECGKAVKSERRLVKTRHHWRLAALSLLLLLLSGGVAHTPNVIRLGWLGSTPTCALALIEWLDPTPPLAVTDELRNRVGTDTTWLDRVCLARLGLSQLHQYVPPAPRQSAFVGMYMGDPLLNSALSHLLDARAQAHIAFDTLLRLAAVETIDQSDLSHALVRVAIADNNRHGYLLRLLSDPALGEFREAAILQMTYSEINSEVVRGLMPHLSVQSDARARRVLVRQLGQTWLNASSREVVVFLTTLERSEQVEFLDSAGNADNQSLLRHALDSEDALTRCRALVNFATIGKTAVSHRPRLAEHALKDPDPECRAWAVQAIGWICSSPENDIDILERAAIDAHPQVRAAAVHFCVTCASVPRRGDVVLSALADGTPQVRSAAARVLPKVVRSDPGVIARLTSLTQDPDALVRQSAISTLAEYERLNTSPAALP